MARTKISRGTASDVEYLADMTCCVCRLKGDHIHHLDGTSGNNVIDNLVLLCFRCHNEASITGSLSRKLSPETIKKYRAHWYEVVRARRENEKQPFPQRVNNITYTTIQNESVSKDDLLVAAKSAIIIIEIVKVKEKYFEAEWDKRGDILSTLRKYYSQSNYHLAKEMYLFLLDISEYNRGQLPKEIALSVWCLVMDFFPHLTNQNKVVETTDLLYKLCEIGYHMAYDNAVYHGDFTTVMYGLVILKYVVVLGKEKQIKEALDMVKQMYTTLKKNLDTANDKNYLELIGFFNDDLPKKGLQFPMLSDHLMKVIYPERFNFDSLTPTRTD